MLLKNHIAYRFLLDDDFALEMVESTYPKEYKLVGENAPDPDKAMIGKVAVLYDLVSTKKQKAFYVTETVLDKLEMLKVKRRENGQYDWSVFKDLAELKYTFIMPPIDGSNSGICLRMKIGNSISPHKCRDHVMELVYLSFNRDKGSKLFGHANWEMLYVDFEKNLQCDHFDHPNCRKLNLDELIYKLLCFIFLSDNEEEIIAPGQKKGTRRQGKIMNILPFPLTIVNSKWNITSVRTEGFSVSGHFALRWTGHGRTKARMVLIEPYEKHGYIRHASKTAVTNKL